MKRFIALFIITIFISAQGVYAQDIEPKSEISSDLNNEQIYKIYSDSLDKLFNSKSFENNTKYECTRNGEKLSNAKINLITKQVNKGISDFDIYLNMITSYNLFSDSIKYIENNDIYYKNGYSYMEVSGEKLKQEISFCEMLSVLGGKEFYLGIVKDAIKDASVKPTDDGGKEIKFDIYYDKISSSVSYEDDIKYRIESIVTLLEIMNLKEGSQNDFKYIVKINKDGVIVSGSLSCNLKTDKDELINFNYNFNISGINNTNVSFPNLNNYMSLEEFMKDYYGEEYNDDESYNDYDEDEYYRDFFEYYNYDIKNL